MSWSISEMPPSWARSAAGEIAEVVDRQRQVGVRRLADRLAVVHRLDERERLEVGLDPVGDPVEDVRAVGGRGACSSSSAAAWAASSALSTSSWVERATSHSGWPVIGVGLVKYCPRTGATILTADPVVVAGADRNRGLEAGGGGGQRRARVLGAGSSHEILQGWDAAGRALAGPRGGRLARSSAPTVGAAPGRVKPGATSVAPRLPDSRPRQSRPIRSAHRNRRPAGRFHRTGPVLLASGVSGDKIVPGTSSRPSVVRSGAP